MMKFRYKFLFTEHQRGFQVKTLVNPNKFVCVKCKKPPKYFNLDANQDDYYKQREVTISMGEQDEIYFICQECSDTKNNRAQLCQFLGHSGWLQASNYKQCCNKRDASLLEMSAMFVDICINR